MTAFIQTIKLIYEIVTAARQIVAFIEENKNEAWFQNAAKTFSNLRAAKTPEEKANASRAIRDILTSIR